MPEATESRKAIKDCFEPIITLNDVRVDWYLRPISAIRSHSWNLIQVSYNGDSRCKGNQPYEDFYKISLYFR